MKQNKGANKLCSYCKADLRLQRQKSGFLVMQSIYDNSREHSPFRGMIRNVQLGHSLFDLINKEKQRKVSSALMIEQMDVAKYPSQQLFSNFGTQPILDGH